VAGVHSVVEVVDQAGLGPAKALVISLVEAVLGAENVAGTVVVAFVDEPTIAALNEQYRALSEPTDVLSFRYADAAASPDAFWPEEFGAAGGKEAAMAGSEPLSAGPTLDLGEVIVCPAVVRHYARSDGVDPGQQLAWTLVHGTLHLVGYDHERDEGEMREREKALLRELDRLVRAILFPDEH
jgi:probable rRNA maturation factor